MKFALKNIYFVLFFFSALYISGCYLPNNSPLQQNLPSQPNNNGFQQNPPNNNGFQQSQPNNNGRQPDPPRAFRDLNEDRDRDNRLESARRRRGSACEDQRSSHECYRQCQLIYRNNEDRNECRELDPESIESIYEVYNTIESGRNFQDINLEHFEWLLEVSIAGIDVIIREYSRSDAEEFLIWIAENNGAAKIMRDEDDDFRRLGELLSSIIAFDRNNVERPFIRQISSDSLFDYALYAENQEALDYFLDYILMTDSACNDKTSKRCLTVICSVGRATRVRNRDLFLASFVFEDFIEDIIRNNINIYNSQNNQNGWRDGRIRAPSDLDNSWADQVWNITTLGQAPVCGGL